MNKPAELEPFLELVKQAKCGPEKLALPILDNDRVEFGHLVAIGEGDWYDNTLVDAIFRWRARSMDAFATRFTPHRDKTIGYLKNIAFPKPDRILFRILNCDGRLSGHIGLCNINAETADIDNLMKGGDDVPTDLIFQAEKALVAWCFSHGPQKIIGADVLDTNLGAQLIHRMAGFRVTKRSPLDQRILPNGDEVLELAADPGNPTSKLKYLRMDLTKPP